MARTTKKITAQIQESDSVYLLKIVLYVILGAIWLRFPEPIAIGAIEFGGFPVGLLIGLLFASHDHFQVDRKIEYVVLIMASIISSFLPISIML